MNSQQPPPSSPPPGWYADGPGWVRRWDGARWTGDRRPAQPPPQPPPSYGQPAPSYGQHLPPTPFWPGGFTAPPKRSLLWLWVTLAVVLVIGVGAATALVVLEPWEDDSGAAAVRGDQEPEDSSGAGSSEGADPTDAAPDAVPDAITGDIDGDGHGDAVAVFRDRAKDPIKRITLTSDGSSFAASEQRLATFEDRTWADFDDDGALDEVTWSVESRSTLTLTSADLQFAELNFPIELDQEQPYVSLRSGDFDGDGAVDLVAYGTASPTSVRVWFLRNNGSVFGKPQEWLTIRNTTYLSTELYAADFTGDGLADLGARLPAERVKKNETYYGGRLGVAMLTSTGSGFEQGSIERPSDDLDRAILLVGDFTGDGSPLVLGLGSGARGIEVAGYAWDGSSFAEVPGWRGGISGESRYRLSGAAVSDVDGDGVDDVVYAAFDSDGKRFSGFRVSRSTGSSLENGSSWAETPTCREAYCFLYFQNGT